MIIRTHTGGQSELSHYAIDGNPADVLPNGFRSKSLAVFFSKMEMLPCSIEKMSAEDSFEFAEDYALIKKCNKWIEWRNSLDFGLIKAISKYNDRKEEILEHCLAVLRMEDFLKEQLELLKQGNPSLFSSSNSELKKFLLQFPHHDGNSPTTKWSFQDLTNNEQIFLVSDISQEDAYQMCDGQTSDKIFGQLADAITQQFGSLSLADTTSISELRSTLDLLEEQKGPVEEILKGAEQLKSESLSAMINAQKKIENNILTMFQNVCSIVENPSDQSFTIEDCPVLLPEKSNYLIYILGLSILALSGLYFVRRSKQAKTVGSPTSSKTEYEPILRKLTQPLSPNSRILLASKRNRISMMQKMM